MNCPLCSTAATDGAAECPSCGAIFAKILELRQREMKKAEEALAQASAPPKPLNAWNLRVAAAMIVVAWIVGLALYYHKRLSGS
jgi:hypothetical protein